MKSVTIHHGDSREVIKCLADSSIDSVVCDPPYALVSIVKRFGGKNAAPAKSEGASGVYKRASAGFMGQAWDTGETAFDPEFWGEVWRVLKPGGHLIAASGTRTYHRLACAVEDAGRWLVDETGAPVIDDAGQPVWQHLGFEVRDMISWLYGSGFPKSHDVAKGIDRVGGLSPADQARLLREHREAMGWSRERLAAEIGCTPASVRDWEEGRARAVGRAIEWIVPSDHYRTALADLLSYSADERRAIGVVYDRRGDGSVIGLGHSGKVYAGAATDAARAWEGWGTALKPACEPWVLARKPLEGTVAANVLAHGTGALNIDGCRIHGEDAQGGAYTVKRLKPGATLDKTGGNWRPEEGGVEYHGEMKPGRWPANVIHDGSDEVVDAFPAEAGAFAPVRGTEPSNAINNVLGQRDRVATHHHGDRGSAARFFYSAKADADDRMGSKHPTVKPIDLMRYLVRLVTPPDGVVLDPFAGSGSTGVAAMLEGFESIMIEREAQYVADIERKVAYYRGEGRLAAQEKGMVGAEPADALPLFADRAGEAA